MHTIHELAAQGKPIRAIAREVGVARNTVRKYLRGKPVALPRRPQPSKLDPFNGQIRRWVLEDHLYNCVTMLARLRALGYTGGLSLLKAFVHPLRPPAAGRRPVIRYESKAGEQMQFDWAEFQYEQEGVLHKVFGFTAVLSYSRMRFVTFVKRTDAPTLIRCLMEAFEYFGGLPRAVLTDRMKTVLLEMEAGRPHWHPVFSDFVSSLAVAPRVCKPLHPTDQGQSRTECRRHQTRLLAGDPLQRPGGPEPAGALVDRWTDEGLRPLPTGFAWERFGTEERKVSWDGYLSYDGVLYGLPSEPAMTGRQVQVRERQGIVTAWYQGQLVLRVAKRARSGTLVPHPEQFRTVASAAAQQRASTPLGHQVPAPQVAHRNLAEYDQLYCVEGWR